MCFVAGLQPTKGGICCACGYGIVIARIGLGGAEGHDDTPDTPGIHGTRGAHVDSTDGPSDAAKLSQLGPPTGANQNGIPLQSPAACTPTVAAADNFLDPANHVPVSIASRPARVNA